MVQSLRFGTDQLPIHAGRYRLVVSPLCPWCRRVVITYRLLGLDQAIALSQSCGRGPDGFEFEAEGYSYDPVLQVRTARELYRRQPDWEDGQPTTVPLIIDHRQQRRIVSHDSADLIEDFLTVWRPFWKFRAPDLYPSDLKDQIDQFDQQTSQQLIPLLGKVIHAPKDQLLDADLNRELKRLENLLSQQQYLLSDQPTIADIRVFGHLVSALGVSEQLLAAYPRLNRYYQKLFNDPQWVSSTERQALASAAATSNSAVSQSNPVLLRPDSATQAVSACSL